MKKNYVKIALDIIMTLLLLLMYSKNSVSMSFHEIGGLAVFGMFFIHKGLNWKWIVGVSRRLTNKTLPARTKLGYVLDALLLVTMTVIIISGIMISKVLFPGLSGDDMFWKMIHYFASAVSIILLGIHLGMHWSFIRNMTGRMLKLPHMAVKPLSIVCIVAVLAYGGYSMTSTSFIRWLAMPFSIATVQNGELYGKGERPTGIPREGQRPEGKPDAGFGQNNGRVGSGSEQGNTSFDIGRMPGVIGSYGSIMSIFAALTILIEKLARRKREPVPSKI